MAFASSLVMLFFGLCMLHANPTGGRTVVSFSARLIHRDPPESPLYDPTSTPSSRFHADVQRSIDRANFFHNVSVFANSNSRLLTSVDRKLYSSTITNYKGSYMMGFDIGTGNSKQQTIALIDTGSHLNWLLCKPCNKCYRLNDGLFDPKDSPTYNRILCIEDACSSLRRSPCRSTNSLCIYNNIYLDGFSARGVLSSETLGFTSSDGKDRVSVPGILFGCTHETTGSSAVKAGMGIISLSGHPLSLTRQLNPADGRSNKFSYCLPRDTSKSSRIYFGPEAGVSGMRALISGLRGMTTSLFIINDHYYLNLEDILVASREVVPLNFTANQVKGPHIRNEGNILIDSGTTLTFIEAKMMEVVTEELVKRIPNPKVDAPETIAHIIDLCFDWKEPMEDKKMPRLIMRFAGGAELEFAKTFFLQKKNNYNVLCLAVTSNSHSKGNQILGNRGHAGYRTVYDLDEKQITFLPENC